MKTSSGLLFAFLVLPTTLAAQQSVSEQSNAMSNLVLLHNEARSSARRCDSKRMPAAHELSWNSKLSTAARKHAKDMARNKFMSHTGSDKSNFSERAKAEAYRVSYLAENIGQGYSSAKKIFYKWLDSTAHCRNIMNGNYQDIGAAKVGDSWVVMYGRE